MRKIAVFLLSAATIVTSGLSLATPASAQWGGWHGDQDHDRDDRRIQFNDHDHDRDDRHRFNDHDHDRDDHNFHGFNNQRNWGGY